MVHASFWYVHLHVRDEQGTQRLHLLLFVRCDTIRPVTRMHSVVRHQVVYDGVSSQLVKLHVLVMPFSVLEYNDFMDPVILRSAWF